MDAATYVANNPDIVRQYQQTGAVPGMVSNDVYNYLTSNYGAQQTSPTTTGGTYSGGGGYSAPAVDPNAQVRSAINSSFDTQISGLRDLLNAVPTQQSRATQQVNNYFGTNRSALESARTQGLNNLSAAETRTLNDRDVAVRRLSEMGRNSLQAFNNQLGTFGAGSSSAALSGADAVGKDQQRIRSDIFGQVQDNLTQIDLAEQGVESDFNIQLSQLRTWRDNSMLDIAGKYEDIQRQIKQQIAGAEPQRQLALAQLSQEIASSAVSALQDVEGTYQSQMSGIAGAATSGAPTVNTSSLSVTAPQMNRPQYSAPSATIQRAGGGLQSGTGMMGLLGRRQDDLAVR
jgi:hypothetical protein